LGVRKKLAEAGLIDLTDGADSPKARELGLFFPSYKATLDKAFKVAFQTPGTGAFEKVEDYVSKTSATQRSEAHKKILHSEPTVQQVAGLWSLEIHILQSAHNHLYKVAGVKLSELAVKEKLQRFRKNLVEPYQTEIAGYGIPLFNEMPAPSLSDAELEGINAELEDWLKATFPQEQAEIDRVQQNIDVLKAKVLELRRSASGGLGQTRAQ
jgi:hypothetical protein